MKHKNTFNRDSLSLSIKNALSGVIYSLLLVLPTQAVEFNVDMIDVVRESTQPFMKTRQNGWMSD